MIDKSKINLLSLVQGDVNLKKTANTNGGEYHGPCPFCGGKDRFIVWPQKGTFKCRQCGKGGDCISYVMNRDSVTFPEACQTLGITLDKQARPRQFQYQPKPQQRGPAQTVGTPREWVCLRDDRWQSRAWDFCNDSFDHLYGSSGAQALDYLYQRGFTDETIYRYNIGYNPKPINTGWGKIGELYLRAGIVIPWLYQGQFWNIRIRTLTGETPKYLPPTGVANGLYNAHLIRDDKAVVIVEGEFDALAIQQSARGTVTAVATGGTGGARLNRWLAAIAIAPAYFVAFDNDEPGQLAANWWMGILPGAHRLVPGAHDPNDMLRLDGPAAIEEWLGVA
jgi:DNA primase